MVSKSQIKATSRYNRKTYDNIAIRVKKGEREELKDAILNMGYESINQFIVTAIKEKIAREAK